MLQTYLMVVPMSSVRGWLCDCPQHPIAKETSPWQENITSFHSIRVAKSGKQCVPECHTLSVMNIFEYLNILVTNIYSDIWLYQIFLYKYIRIFIHVKMFCTNQSVTNIFEYSNILVTNIYTHIYSYQFYIRIYSNIRSC